MTTDDLLDFSEAAAVLGVSAEKVRRLVVEDRSITAVRVSAGGARHLVDLDALAEGDIRIDDGGNLLVGVPTYEQRTRVGTTYKPLDMQGGLRIERAQVEHYLDALPQALMVAEVSVIGLSLANPQIGPEWTSGPSPLDPAGIAAAFAGCWGTEMQWVERLSKLRKASWMNAAPVVVRSGIQGTGPDGTRAPTLRDPVELAKGMIKRGHGDTQIVGRRFRGSVELKAWRASWEEHVGWGTAA